MRIYILNGPNLNMLGHREPHIYGNMTYNDLVNRLMAYGQEKGVELVIKQSNHEGDLIDYLHNVNDYDGLIINPAAYSHTSIAILDALKAVDKPAVEVHLTNVHAREAFRTQLVTAKGVSGVISGLGVKGYFLAIDYLLETEREMNL